MRFFPIYISVLTFLLLSACDSTTEQLANSKNEVHDTIIKINKAVIKDSPIENPLKTRKLKLLITNDINAFFLYKGETFGLEYELLKLFLQSKQIDLEIELIKDVEHIRDSLHAHGAHMAAGTFIVPKNKSPLILYSDPIYTIDFLLIKHKDNPNPISKTVVIKDAPYMKHLWNNIPDYLEKMNLIYSPEFTSKQMLLKQVHSKQIESTIADANEVAITDVFYPDIIIDTILEKDAPVGFMFHSKMDTLQAEFNTWLKKNKNTSDYQWILKKYKSLPQKLSKQLTITPFQEIVGKISSYDKLIKNYSASINWDWRLLAALIHQESKFNPTTQSWAGACGLMQVMPNTAYNNSHITKKQLFIPNHNIKAGTNYINWLEHNFFNDTAMSLYEKQKMILASYNVGPGHIADARALCLKYNLNPNVWEGNVEKMILAKSKPEFYNDPICKHGYCHGIETTTYVKNILFYYKNYSAYYKE